MAISVVKYTQPGDNTFVLPAGYTMTFDLYGAGGGGGSSVTKDLMNDTRCNGVNGGDTILRLGTTETLAIAGGGKGGGLGWMYDAFEYKNGVPGVGGVSSVLSNKVSTLASRSGNPGSSTSYTRAGGMSVEEDGNTGQGGEGGYGRTSINVGWSAGGGGGSYVKVVLENKSDIGMWINLTIGRGGEGGPLVISGPTKGGTGRSGGAVVTVNDNQGEFIYQYKNLVASLVADGSTVGTASQSFSVKVAAAQSEISIDPGYKKNHINLWDYFYTTLGRRPKPGEVVNFVIPAERTFVAPFGYTVAKRYHDVVMPNAPSLRSHRHVNVRTLRGSAAVSLVGWDASLNNDITVDVRGTLLGSFVPSNTNPHPHDKATRKPIAYDQAFKSYGFRDHVAAWSFLTSVASVPNGVLGENAFLLSSVASMVDPIKNAAFESPVKCKIIIRSGAYVLGGGGNQTIRPIYLRTDVENGKFAGLGNAVDGTNIQGGPAIKSTSGATISVDNYGYLSGGGGGGNTYLALSSMSYIQEIASGGSGAPLGGTRPSVAFPLYIDLEYIKNLPLQNAQSYIKDPVTQQDIISPTSIAWSEARCEAAIDWSMVGVDANGDNIIDLSVYGDVKRYARLLSPSSGSTLFNGYSGSGGAPGVDGQQAVRSSTTGTDVNNPNIKGLKGRALVQEGNSTINVQNFSGSTYKA